MSEVIAFVDDLLARGGFTIGQVAVSPARELSHVGEAGRGDLEVHRGPQAAIEIARYDDAGRYRPLKSAPNLRRGWKLRLATTGDVCLALDFFYPAALGTWLAFVRGEIEPVPLRETLARQSGMYRIVRRLSNDQADRAVCATCNHASGCLREILWPIQPGRLSPLTVTTPSPPLPPARIPILCVEACNLLIAAARPLAKQNLPPPGPAAP